MLESLESETPNIKDLSVEESAEEKPRFDPKRDITEGDWTQIIARIKEDRQSSNRLRDYYEHCASVKVISPERYNDIDVDDGMFNDYFYLISHESSHSRALEIAKTIKILFPEYANKHLNNEGFWNKSVLFLKTHRVAKNWPEFIKNAAKVRIIFPNRWEDSIFQTDPKIWEEVWSALKDMANQRLHDTTATSVDRFTSVIPDAKIAFPQHIESIDSLIEQIDWDWQNDSLERNRHNNAFGDFVSEAYISTLMAANQIDITDHGIKISFQKKVEDNQPPPPLPEQRSF